VSDREAFLRRFHAARPGITSAALARGDSYDRLAAAVPAGARVLDLGCGDDHLVRRLPDAIGVDLAPARGAPGASRLVQARAQALPFAAASFGAAVSHLAFMLFDDLDAVVGELRRVVAPGGTFAAILGGGPTADGDDAFHRFLALARPSGLRFGDRRASSPDGWRALFHREPSFTRFELDLSGPFAGVWGFLGASYQLADADRDRVAAALRAAFADPVPCRVVLWLATVAL
jgi:SAM-dependent methyltransferase